MQEFLTQQLIRDKSKCDSLFLIANNYFSLILKTHLKNDQIESIIDLIIKIKKQSKNLKNRYFYGLFTNVLIEYCLLKQKYSLGLSEIQKSMLFYQQNNFFAKELKRKEVLQCKKIYRSNKLYLEILNKNQQKQSKRNSKQKESSIDVFSQNLKTKQYKSISLKQKNKNRLSFNSKKSTVQIMNKLYSHIDPIRIENIQKQLKRTQSYLNLQHKNQLIVEKVKKRNNNIKIFAKSQSLHKTIKIQQKPFYENIEKKTDSFQKNFQIQNTLQFCAKINQNQKKNNFKLKTFRIFDEDLQTRFNKQKKQKQNQRNNLIAKLKLILFDEKQKMKEKLSKQNQKKSSLDQQKNSNLQIKEKDNSHKKNLDKSQTIKVQSKCILKNQNQIKNKIKNFINEKLKQKIDVNSDVKNQKQKQILNKKFTIKQDGNIYNIEVLKINLDFKFILIQNDTIISEYNMPREKFDALIQKNQVKDIIPHIVNKNKVDELNLIYTFLLQNFVQIRKIDQINQITFNQITRSTIGDIIINFEGQKYLILMVPQFSSWQKLIFYQYEKNSINYKSDKQIYINFCQQQKNYKEQEQNCPENKIFFLKQQNSQEIFMIILQQILKIYKERINNSNICFLNLDCLKDKKYQITFIKYNSAKNAIILNIFENESICQQQYLSKKMIKKIYNLSIDLLEIGDIQTLISLIYFQQQNQKYKKFVQINVQNLKVQNLNKKRIFNLNKLQIVDQINVLLKIDFHIHFNILLIQFCNQIFGLRIDLANNKQVSKNSVYFIITDIFNQNFKLQYNHIQMKEYFKNQFKSFKWKNYLYKHLNINHNSENFFENSQHVFFNFSFLNQNQKNYSNQNQKS